MKRKYLFSNRIYIVIYMYMSVYLTNSESYYITNCK